MPAHWRWAVIRRRQEWFRLAEREGVHYTCCYYGISRKTYYKWWKRYLASGRDPGSLQDRSRRPKSHPKAAPPEVVKKVIALRKRYGYGPRRLQFYLQRDEKIHASVCGIYKILNRAGLIVRYSRKRRKYQAYAPYLHHPGQKVQIDVKYVPRRPGAPQLFQYQAKDLFTKLRFFRVYDELSAHHTVDFVKRCLGFFRFPIRCLQSDDGAEFTYLFYDHAREHPLDQLCRAQKIRHTLIPVATPRYNGQVERANRTDMEEFYRRSSFKDLPDLAAKLRRYLGYYNEHRPHMAIDRLTPLQKLRSQTPYKNAQLTYGCYP